MLSGTLVKERWGKGVFTQDKWSILIDYAEVSKL